MQQVEAWSPQQNVILSRWTRSNSLEFQKFIFSEFLRNCRFAISQKIKKMKIGKVWKNKLENPKLFAILGSVWVIFGQFLGNFGTIVGPHWGYRVPSLGIFVAVLLASWVTLSHSDGIFGTILGPSWSHLGSSRDIFGAILWPSWTKLGHLGVILEPSLGHLVIYFEPSWNHPVLYYTILGSSWSCLGSSRDIFGVILGPSLIILGHLGVIYLLRTGHIRHRCQFHLLQ